MSSTYTMPFEEPVVELDRQIDAIAAREDAEKMEEELTTLRSSRDSLLQKIYTQLSPWDTVRVARHPLRPQTADYINLICRDFRELHGDRHFGDDKSIITGLGRIGSIKVLVVGHQKGRTTQERIACHFGCAHPEGYRKALNKMRLAEKFGLPIVTFIDTPGAYPGLKAEERGQAEAIAVNLRDMSRLKTPIVSVVIGEGGSGGALGIGVADRVAMLQHSWYSVISPEGCAGILWRDGARAQEAADTLRLTGRDLLELGCIDEIVPEPLGGAHKDHRRMAQTLRSRIVENLRPLLELDPAELVEKRYARLRRIGAFERTASTT